MVWAMLLVEMLPPESGETGSQRRRQSLRRILEMTADINKMSLHDLDLHCTLYIIRNCLIFLVSCSVCVPQLRKLNNWRESVQGWIVASHVAAFSMAILSWEGEACPNWDGSPAASPGPRNELNEP